MDTFQLIGSIDVYQNDVLTGWIKNNIDESKVTFVIAVNSVIVTSPVLADVFRSDLLENKIGDGCYGFSIVLPQNLLTTGENTIEIIDNITGLAFSQKLSYVKQQNLNKTINFHSITPPFIRVYHENKEFSRNNYIFSIDNAIINDMLIHVDSNFAVFRIPKEYLDGMPHIISITDTSSNISCTRAEIIQDCITPAEIVERSKTEIAFTRLSAISAQRSESFFNKVSKIAHSDTKLNFELISLVEAYKKSFAGANKNKAYSEIILPKFSEPKVSIIIPVHNKFEYTYFCLNSIKLAYNKTSFEVIIIDDNSSDETVNINKHIKNTTVIKNKENLGFLLSCNKAAQIAVGEYIVFLNNDTEVTQFWLDELIAVFENFENVGIAGSKLIYPNGSLQEAGGIVWQNAKPWNVGRGNNPWLPCYCYTREVDYVSGAALMIKKDIWQQIGGFTESFAPAYYEDTDLAFKAREAGYKVLLAALSTVIHYEGISCGKDTKNGIKQFQAINAAKFRAKWLPACKNNGREGIDLEYNKDRNVLYRILMIDYKTPEPDKDAGSYAAIQEIRMLQANGCKITFLPENMAHMGTYTEVLQRMGVECIIAPFYTSVNEYLETNTKKYDAIYITRYAVAEKYIDTIRKFPEVKIIFNNADLHFLRELRMATSQNDVETAVKIRDKELSVIRKVDTVLTYTEIEKAVILSHNLRDDNIYICPWVTDVKAEIKPFKNRKNISFLGGYRHPPNIEAVRYMANMIMPEIRKDGVKINLEIFGSHVPDEFYKIKYKDIIIKGYVQNLCEIFDNTKIFIAPLQSGAGIKGKVLEAMSYGVPCILSPIAAEGIDALHGVHVFIAKNVEEYIKYISLLYNDEHAWRAIQNASLQLIREKYSLCHGILKIKQIVEMTMYC